MDLAARISCPNLLTRNNGEIARHSEEIDVLIVDFLVGAAEVWTRIEEFCFDLPPCFARPCFDHKAFPSQVKAEKGGHLMDDVFDICAHSFSPSCLLPPLFTGRGFEMPRTCKDQTATGIFPSSFAFSINSTAFLPRSPSFSPSVIAAIRAPRTTLWRG